MLTAEWSWKGNVLYFMNVTLQRGEREPEPEPEPESLLSAEIELVALPVKLLVYS